jgi:hypothetical protein
MHCKYMTYMYVSRTIDHKVTHEKSTDLQQ